jgi:hypothetical protein
VPAGTGRGGAGAGGGFWDSRGPASSMVWAGGVKGGGEGAVVDGVNDVIIRDGITTKGSFPVDSLGGLVGVPGSAASDEDEFLESNPCCQGDGGGN